MKKLLAFILTIFYLASTTGATVHMHYCMGKMVDKSFWHNDDKQCGKCGMEKSGDDDNGCCKDEHKQFKIDNEHKITTSSFPVLQLDDALSALYFEKPLNFHLATVTEKHPVSNAPPGKGSIPIYIRNNVFRI